MVDHTFLYKQCIAVRGDIQMSAGKFAVQVAHASVGSILRVKSRDEIEQYSTLIVDWFREGFRKIVLKVNSEQDIRDLEQECIDAGVSYYVVEDFGLTELEPNTVTCIGIGPDLNEKVDKITGRLKLWR